MNHAQSHEGVKPDSSTNKIKVFIKLALGLGLILLLGGGLYFGISRWKYGVHRQELKERQARVESLSQQIQFDLSESVEAIRLRALEIDERYQRKMPPALSEGPILYWAKLEFKPTPRVVSVARSSQLTLEGVGELVFSSQFERHFLQHLGTLSSKMDNKMNASKGVGSAPLVMRLKKDSLRTREWLSFVFVKSPLEAVAVIVEPQYAFQNILRTGNGKVAMNQRAYLLGTDGVVLAHSLENYAGADFSGWMGRLIQGKVSLGTSPEKIKTQAGVYSLAGSLSSVGFLLGVEEWLPPPKAGLNLRWQDWALGVGLILALILGLGAPFVGGVALLQKVVKFVQKPKKAPSEVPAPAKELEELSAAEPFAKPFTKPFEGPAVVLSPLPSGAAVREFRAMSEGLDPDDFEDLVAPEALQIHHQAVEAQFFNELKMDHEDWSQKRRDNVLLSQFEMSTAQAAKAKSTTEVAETAVQSVHDVFGLPALIYSYCAKTRLAVLQASAGLKTDSSAQAGSLSFPVSEDLLLSLKGKNPAEQSRVLAVYPPLKSSVLFLGNALHFRVWTLRRTHFTQFEPILGFLVVLGAGEELERAFEAKDRSLAMMRILETSNLAYEFTTHSS